MILQKSRAEEFSSASFAAHSLPEGLDDQDLLLRQDKKVTAQRGAEL